ncbi:MAG TPA: protein kinase [Polyangiaceae bacterium]|nr:protein kinase [Polyangiaceae bacterium]
MIHRELVPGKLQIVRRIGAGGMGVVYEAIQLGLHRRVAVKVIHPQSSESSEARTRFLREARALALLRSQHIVQVLDVDTLAEGDPYMVMEYLEGRDLKRELTKRGPLPVDEAVGYVIQAAAGVAAAHGAGIIHRDIKPANLFVTNLDGARQVKILDFGVAKFSVSADQGLTGPTNRLGTLLYMSPEQIAGSEADIHSDLWALGVVLFQLLAGYPPFRPSGSEGTLSAILNGAPASLHEARPDVPLALSRIVARCFERSRTERYADARELAAALAPFGWGEPTVRASRQAPRGSSAPPPAAALENGLALGLIAARQQEVVSIRELITVTHAGPALHPPTPSLTEQTLSLVGNSLTDETTRAKTADATIPFRPASLSPVAAVGPSGLAPSLNSKSNDSKSRLEPFWRKFAVSMGGLVFLALVLAVSWPLLVPRFEVTTVAEPRAATSAVASPEPMEVRVLAEAPRNLATPVQAAATERAPEPVPSAARHSRALAPSGSPASVSMQGPSAKARLASKPAALSAPTGSAAVPLHL